MLHRLSYTDKNGISMVGFLDHHPFRLCAMHSVIVPALCQARIPHGVVLESSYTASAGETVDTRHTLVSLVPETLAMVTHNLIVQAGPVDDGDIFTYVFNLSNEQLIFRKGESISRLVKLVGSVWR